jgi:hypothetical protein
MISESPLKGAMPMIKKSLFHKWQFWVALTQILIALIALIIPRQRPETYPPSAKEARESTKPRVHASLRILYPADGGFVGRTEWVKGSSSYGEGRIRHFLVVTPQQTGEPWVQEGPLGIPARGIWAGWAIFGAAGVGEKKRFLLQVMATKSPLSPGPLIQVPQDAVFSEPVSVTRLY